MRAFLVIGLLLLSSHTAYGGSGIQKDKIVAVFTFIDTGAGLSDEVLEGLTDYLAQQMTDSGQWMVIPPKKIHEMIKELKDESYKECYDESCQIQLGRELAAQVMLRTKILKIGGSCQIMSQLIDLKSKVAQRAANLSAGCDESSLWRTVRGVAARINQPVAISAPKINTSLIGQGGSEKVQKLVKSALEAQADRGLAPEQKHLAWCRLSRIADNNPYREQADQACKEWDSYIGDYNQRKTNIVQQHDRLIAQLKHDQYSGKEKENSLKMFEQTYRDLAHTQEYRNILYLIGNLHRDNNYIAKFNRAMAEFRALKAVPETSSGLYSKWKEFTECYASEKTNPYLAEAWKEMQRAWPHSEEKKQQDRVVARKQQANVVARAQESRSTYNFWTYTLVASGAVLAGGGAYCAVMTGNKMDERDQKYKEWVSAGSLDQANAIEPQINDLDDEARLYRTLSYAGLGLGAAVMVSGLVVYLFAPEVPEQMSEDGDQESNSLLSARPALLPTGVGLEVFGRW